MGYFKDIDLNNDEAVLKFLKGHDVYIINGDIIPYTCYSNNIKIYNLDVTNEEKEKLYDLLNLDESSFDIQMQFDMLNEEFNAKHPGYYIIVNGRSGGYLVLSSDNARSYQNEVVHPEDLSKYERRELAEIVTDFDKFCDDYIAGILAIINDSEIVEEEVTYTKKIRVLRPKKKNKPTTKEHPG